jgi:prepilin-type N-terminal cleavage/methylation domain-containing protein
MSKRHTTPERGFTLVELMAVIAILAILVALAMPSWRAAGNEALIQQAKSVLQRLAIRQHRFLRGNGRFAKQDELPPLASLGSSVARRYQLRVESDVSHYSLRLIDPDGELPSLALNHLGQWASSEGISP